MEQFARAALEIWAGNQPEIVGLFVYGSRARGTARLDSDLNVALELAGTSPQSLFSICRERWRRELATLTGMTVKDIHLRGDRHVSGEMTEVYRRATHHSISA